MLSRSLPRLLLACVVLLATSGAFADWDPFVVDSIEIEGAERVAEGTVLNYLPIREGDEITPEDGRQAIRQLYEAELFDDVELRRSDDDLIVRVGERPAIGELNIEGSFEMDEERLRDTLAEIGVERGRIFNRSLLEQSEQELRQLLLGQGKYALELETEVRELDENRVAIDLTLNEGKTARIRQVNIIGNESFSDDTLKDEMESGVKGALQFLSSRDEYSRQRLEGDLENIRSWYLDRGYLQFAITSTQVSLTPDRRDIYVTINVEEGDRYDVGDVDIAGDLPIDRDTVEEQVSVEEGQLFKRSDVTDSESDIADILGAAGYAFADVEVDTDVDESDRTVDISFRVDPGKRAYVRRVEFTGQDVTQDEVYRREMRQIEGATYSPQQVERSRVRIQRLPQVEQVSVDTERVGEDQVDIVYDIRERRTGSLSFGAGVSSSQGLVFNASLEERNLLGTGQDLTLSVDTSEDTTGGEIRFRDPYHTIHGVSRTLRARYQETDPSDISSQARYFSDSGTAGVSYGIPLGEFDRMNAGLAVEGDRIQTTTSTPDEIVDFLDEEGNEFLALEATVGYRRDTRNRTVFPDEGHLNRVSLTAAVPGSDLEYYRAQFNHETYFPLSDRFTASLSGDVAAGSGFGDQEELPFYNRFFAGGIRSVRGYERNSLGPRFEDETDQATGGDLRTTGTAELSFPPPFVEESGGTRLSLFYDFGTVFRRPEDFDVSDFRSSVGVSFNWRSPVGPLSFSLASPIDDEPGDDTEVFQFTIGTMF